MSEEPTLIVIDGNGNGKGVRVKLKERRSRRCQHRRSLALCSETRLVECDDCGAWLDAFDCLYRVAQGELELEYRARDLIRRIEELERRRGEVATELKRLKGAVCRAKKQVRK